MIIKLFLPVFFVLISFVAQSQKVVEKVIQRTSYTEYFTVLKRKKKIKHGPYSRKSFDGKLLINGQYTQGRRSGIWTNYDLTGKIYSKGKYDNYYKDSIWEYFGSTGLVERKVDHNQNEIIYYDPKADTSKTHIIINGVEKKVDIEWPSYYKGGVDKFLKVIRENFEYPEVAREKSESGTTYVTFTIGIDGIAKNYKIVKSASPSLDQEALRVIKLIPNNWVAPIYNGKPVESFYTLPIRARLG